MTFWMLPGTKHLTLQVGLIHQQNPEDMRSLEKNKKINQLDNILKSIHKWS